MANLTNLLDHNGNTRSNNIKSVGERTTLQQKRSSFHGSIFRTDSWKDNMFNSSASLFSSFESLSNVAAERERNYIKELRIKGIFCLKMIKLVCCILNCKKINLLQWLMSKSLKFCNVGSWKNALCSHRPYLFGYFRYLKVFKLFVYVYQKIDKRFIFWIFFWQQGAVLVIGSLHHCWHSCRIITSNVSSWWIKMNMIFVMEFRFQYHPNLWKGFLVV